jgi:hypothetical protein
MIIKLRDYRINILTSYYKDYRPSDIVVTPYIYINYGSSKYYYEKKYHIGVCWLYWNLSVNMYIGK